MRLSKSRNIKQTAYFIFLMLLGFSCAMDSNEELMLSWEEADSLQNRIPGIQILTPQENDTVEVPFTINYKLSNWEITEGGRHIQYFIQGQNKGISYSSSLLNITKSDTGYQNFTLQLVNSDFTHIPVSDDIQLYVKPIPEATYPLFVNNGLGSGNYLANEIVVISASEPAGGMQFTGWLGDTVHLSNPEIPITTLVMPESEVNLTAHFEEIPISFTADIKPIFEKSCLSCHTQLYTPFLKISARIQDQTAPMPPSGLLPQAEINLILKWIEQGADCTN